ncbi:hypothetical protein HVW60_01805 [Escherichia coli]|nr:hypothetical protein [Escherichia coli]EIM6127744.1 hypothetical protein [Escherichia coli]EJF9147253.1 hypothetical protein [Escherichia coli]EJG2807444.1 hypothetical protein [Escherichia coli]QMN83600.1 hypothetical protein HVW60_01805 [Escherichia coli]HAW0694671.1 hypothetical protein [Escherichia coli]
MLDSTVKLNSVRQANPQSEHCAIRINPNRSGEETVLRILRESIASI